MSQPSSYALRVLGSLVAALVIAPALGAQQMGTITGRVTDDQTGQPMASVQVYIPALDIGVLSQQNGRYLLLNVPAGAHEVTAERIGHRASTQSVTVGAGQAASLDFVLDVMALQLDEVIVTGTPGGTQRRAIGNSIEVLSASAVTEQAPVTSLQGLMAARTPGLRFDRSMGQVGQGSTITIRGVSSTELGSQPLVYVDGIRVDNDPTVGPNTGSSSSSSALAFLNPDDIESIEVIKGPSAATLYGTEASAGVIQIITKKGNVGAPEFEFEVSRGASYMRDPQGTLGTQYACAVAAARCAAADIVEYQMYDEAGAYLRSDGRFAGVAGLGRTGNLFQNGPMQRYNMSVRGGVEQVRYYIAGTLTDEEGVVDYNTNRQTALRANVTVLFNQNLNLDISTGYTQGDARYATIDEEGGIWHQLVWSRGYNLPGVRAPSGVGFLGFQERFPDAYERTDVSHAYSRFTGGMTATHRYGDWFNQRLTLGVDRSAATDKEFIPGDSDFPNAPEGFLTYGRPINENLTFDYAASGRYAINEAFGTNTSVGFHYYSRFEEQVTNSGRGFPTAIQTVIDQTEFGDRQVDFSSIENKSLGIYVQEELSWNDRLFVTGAMTADDNSAFGSEFDLQYYPKLSASWVISEEPFWTFGGINSLRLRGAWGTSGRQPGTFAGQTLYTTFLGPDGNGLIPSTAGNPEIGPEVSSEIDVGFDVALLNDRLSLEFSRYNITTSDLLVNQSLAPTTGLTGSRQANLGEMKTWGWEVSVDSRLFESPSAAFDLTVSADFTDNEITSLGEDILPTGNFQIGWPFPNVSTDHWLLSAELNTAGTAGNAATAMCDGGQPAAPGGPNIMPGGDPILCSAYNDAGILLGPAYANYSFHVAPTLTLFNDLQVFALAEGQYGRWVASVDAQYACGIYRNCKKAVEGTDPMFLLGRLFGAHGDDRYQGRFPADFWAMRQIGARYSLPADLVARIGADRASLSFAANNPFRIWQKVKTDLAGNPIYDPEYAINGNQPQQIALWEMPGMASVSVTLRVTF